MDLLKFLSALVALCVFEAILLVEADTEDLIKKKLLALGLLSGLRFKKKYVLPFPVPLPVPYLVKKILPPIVLPPKKVPVLVPKPVPVYHLVPKFVPVHHHRKVLLSWPQEDWAPQGQDWEGAHGHHDLGHHDLGHHHGFGDHHDFGHIDELKAAGSNQEPLGFAHPDLVSKFIDLKGGDLQMSASSLKNFKVSPAELKALMSELKALNSEIKVHPGPGRMALGDIPSLKSGERRVHVGEIRIRPSELKELMASGEMNFNK